MPGCQAGGCWAGAEEGKGAGAKVANCVQLHLMSAGGLFAKGQKSQTVFAFSTFRVFFEFAHVNISWAFLQFVLSVLAIFVPYVSALRVFKFLTSRLFDFLIVRLFEFATL